MIVQKLISRGVAFLAEDDGQILAEVFDEVARLFIAAPGMLVVCKKLVEIESKANTDGDMDWDLLAEVTALARNVVERVEGEWECGKK